MHLLDYGTAVRISPGALETFYMVQVPLAGSAQLRSAGSTVESTPNLASIPPIDHDFSMTWQAGTPQLIVTAPRELLNDAAAALYGARLEGPLKLANSMDMASAGGPVVHAVGLRVPRPGQHPGGRTDAVRPAAA